MESEYVRYPDPQLESALDGDNEHIERESSDEDDTKKHGISILQSYQHIIEEVMSVGQSVENDVQPPEERHNGYHYA